MMKPCKLLPTGQRGEDSVVDLARDPATFLMMGTLASPTTLMPYPLRVHVVIEWITIPLDAEVNQSLLEFPA